MKNGHNARRGRGRSNAKGSAVGQRFNDGNRGEQRVRGNPSQQMEKYKSLARDAMGSGDRILAEHYFQHADHFLRIVNERQGPRSQDQDNTGADAGNDRNRPRRARRGRANQEQDTRADGAAEAAAQDQGTTVSNEAQAPVQKTAEGEAQEATPKPRRRRTRKVEGETLAEAADVKAANGAETMNGADTPAGGVADKPKRGRRKKATTGDESGPSVEESAQP